MLRRCVRRTRELPTWHLPLHVCVDGSCSRHVRHRNRAMAPTTASIAMPRLNLRNPLWNRSARSGSPARDARNRMRLAMDEWRQLRSSRGMPFSVATRPRAEANRAAPVLQTRSTPGSSGSPSEWTLPYHEFVKDGMAKLPNERLHLPVEKTLHITHVMVQTATGLMMGMSGKRIKWKSHLFRAANADGQEHVCHLAQISLQLQDDEHHRHEKALHKQQQVLIA